MAPSETGKNKSGQHEPDKVVEIIAENRRGDEVSTAVTEAALQPNIPQATSPIATDGSASIDTEPMSIPKPENSDEGLDILNRFKSKRPPTIAGVETLQTGLPHHSVAAAKDFVRLHPDEAQYWSPELCFVHIPIKGQKQDTLHLIDEDLAREYLPSGNILRFRLALASMPNDVFFLCHVPSQNLDNLWNETNLEGCEQGKTRWVKLTSRKAEGVEGYKILFAKDADAFPPPNWPKEKLGNLIVKSVPSILTKDSPALLRLIGARQKLS